MISDEEYQAESTSAAADGRSAGTVVARPALFGRLGELARVTVVSAPAGSLLADLDNGHYFSPADGRDRNRNESGK